MNDDSTIVEAVLIKKDRIQPVGSTAELLDLVSEDTLVQDLTGKTLMPGFIDAHGHFPGSGLNTIAVILSSLPIGETLSIEQLLAQLSAHATTVDEGEWVLGMGYDNTLLQEMRYPTRDKLGSITPSKLADLVVLDKNPLRDPELIKYIRVEQTFVGGVSIYQSKT